MAQSAALAPRKEVPSLIPDSSSRPADLYLPRWKRGLPTACDLTVISPVQNLTLDRAAEIQGYAITVAEERKLRAHWGHCHQSGISFIPLAVESFGALGQRPLFGNSESYRLSVAICRQHIRSVTSTRGFPSPSGEGTPTRGPLVCQSSPHLRMVWNN